MTEFILIKFHLKPYFIQMVRIEKAFAIESFEANKSDDFVFQSDLFEEILDEQTVDMTPINYRRIKAPRLYETQSQFSNGI